MRPLSTSMVARSLLVYGIVRAVVLPLQAYGGVALVVQGQAIVLGLLLVLDALMGAVVPRFAARSVGAGRRSPSPARSLVGLAVLDGLVFGLAFVTGPIGFAPFGGTFVALLVIDLLAASTLRAAERDTL